MYIRSTQEDNHVSPQALIQDQISTSPSCRAVDAPRGRSTDIITYIIKCSISPIS